MGATFAEKVLAIKSGATTLQPGEIVEVSPDVALSHDNTAPILQIFHDMVMAYVGEGIDEYPDDPESIHYVYYDCTASILWPSGSRKNAA